MKIGRPLHCHTIEAIREQQLQGLPQTVEAAMERVLKALPHWDSGPSLMKPWYHLKTKEKLLILYRNSSILLPIDQHNELSL